MSLTKTGREQPTAGIVLCGGYSSRMGRDKASLELGDRSFLQHMCATLADVCHPLLLVGRADQNQMPESFHGMFPFVADLVPDAGPLAGLVTGLETFRRKSDLALVVACDTPLIHPAAVQFLARKIGDFDAVIPWDGEHLFGLTAVYRTTAAIPLRQMLNRGQRRIQDIADSIRVRKISLDELRQADPELDSLLGCNTPEEYEVLLARFRKIGTLGA